MDSNGYPDEQELKKTACQPDFTQFAGVAFMTTDHSQELRDIRAAVGAWIESAPDAVKEYFGGSIMVLNFWRDERNRNFQQPGRYDGAMDEECKALNRRQYAICDEICEASQRWYTRQFSQEVKRDDET